MEITANFNILQMQIKPWKMSIQLCFITQSTNNVESWWFVWSWALLSIRSNRMWYFCEVKLMLLCPGVFLGVSIQDVAASLLPAAAVFVPAACSVLCFALWTERLLGFFSGQHGEHWEDGNDERWGRRFSHGTNPLSRDAHVPLWLPLPAEGRSVLRPWLVTVRGR